MGAIKSRNFVPKVYEGDKTFTSVFNSNNFRLLFIAVIFDSHSIKSFEIVNI